MALVTAAVTVTDAPLVKTPPPAAVPASGGLADVLITTGRLLDKLNGVATKLIT